MRQFNSIVRREVGAFFHSSMAPILLGGFLLIVGMIFLRLMTGYSDLSTQALQNSREGNFVNLVEGVFRPMVSTMVLLFVLIVPSLTMRLFSSEYSSGRYNLLASWPISDHLWVLGKWFSAWISSSMMLLASMVLFVSVWFFGSPELGPLLAVTFGLLLLTSSLVAVGIWASVSFTHQILAYFVTLITAIMLFMIQLLERILPGMLGKIALELSLKLHFERFSQGVIDSRDVVYFVLLTVLPLVAAVTVLAGRRLSAKKKILHWVPTLLSLVLGGVLYTLSLYMPLTWDFTGNQRYSLAPQTIQILDGLEVNLQDLEGIDEVTVYAFLQRFQQTYNTTEVLLQNFHQQSSSFKFQMVDPETELELVKKYRVQSYGSLVVEVGDRYLTVIQPDESGLVNAVYRLVQGKRPVVGYLLGHGEHQLDSLEMAGYSLTQTALRESGYDLRPLILTETGGVPDDCDVVMVAGPRMDPLAMEAAAIDNHLAKGKAVIFLSDPVTPPGWNSWLENYRVRLSGKVIISSMGQGKISRLLEVIEGYGGHAIVHPLQDVRTLFPFAQGLEVLDDQGAGIKGALLLMSSDLSWAEADPETRFGGQASFDPAVDSSGPVPFGLVMEIPSSLEENALGRMVVIGNSEFANNSMLNRDGNRDLLLNSLGWLAREENLIELRGRDPMSQPVILTNNQKNLVQWGAVVLWPLFVVSLCVGVMIRHKRKAEEGS
ncbi:MAG: hypothetical protein GY780_03655 [bacterium]|nr:hypothetical protein [bacterium]